MNPTKTFKKANIELQGGMLVVNTLYSNRLGLHRNVVIEYKDRNSIVVTADSVIFDVSFNTGSFNLDEITPASIETYKPWPWSKPRQRSRQHVEYLETEKRTYTSNHFTIIE